ELNRLIQSEDLFDDRLFQDVIFRDKTKKLIRNRSDGIDRLLFNRLLMEDAFPHCLRKRATVHVFSEFIDYLVEKEMYVELNKFFSSNYINNIIGEDGFFSLYQIIKRHFVHEPFRDASSGLLDLSAVCEEFQNIFEIEKSLSIQYFSQITQNSTPSELEDKSKIKYADFFPQFRSDLVPNLDRPFPTIIEMEQKGIDIEANINRIESWMGDMICAATSRKNVRYEVLSKFDQLSAVCFNRNNISKTLIQLYNDLANRNLISCGTQMFLEYDTHLSPLTSYPFNNYESLLFSQPFQRIYEDVYILDKNDYNLCIKRARVIYDNFADLLLDFQRAQMRFMFEEHSDYHRVSYENLKAEISTLIFYWNVSVTKFDTIMWHLGHIYETGSGNYHLRSDGFKFNIINLENNMNMLDPDQSESIMRCVYPAEKRNPLTRLRPCKIFNIESKESNLIKLEDILSKLRSELIKEKERGMPIEIDW
ncbi:MAG: hypothetical protein MUO26_01870, partial [Methanotrichaceae archaeon]|nr:hypothetical protein [Methanotrichaceae archaeon]